MSGKSPVSLLNFFVFNSAFCDREDEVNNLIAIIYTVYSLCAFVCDKSFPLVKLSFLFNYVYIFSLREEKYFALRVFKKKNVEFFPVIITSAVIGNIYLWELTFT